MKNALNRWLAYLLVAFAASGLWNCKQSPTDAPATTTDASISETLKASLYSDPGLKGERSKLQLTMVKSRFQARSPPTQDIFKPTERLANETLGVKKVNDLLQVKPSAEAPPQQAPVGASSRPPASAPKPVVKSSPPQTSQPPRAATAVPAVPSASQPASPTPVAPPRARVVTIPAGTSVRVQMIDSVDSAVNKVGESFLASLAAPLVVNDEVIFPKDADVYVRLASAKTSGKFTGQSELSLELDHLKHRGKNYQLSSSTYQEVGASRGKDTAKKTAIGAAIGTAIGAIAGGGKGAAIEGRVSGQVQEQLLRCL